MSYLFSETEFKMYLSLIILRFVYHLHIGLPVKCENIDVNVASNFINILNAIFVRLFVQLCNMIPIASFQLTVVVILKDITCFMKRNQPSNE